MMTVDAIVLVVVLVFLVLGMRRGLLKEVLGAVALVGATWAAMSFAREGGAQAATTLGVGIGVGFMAAGGAIWVVVYFAVQLVGRFVIAQLKYQPTGDGDADAGDAARGAFGSTFGTLDAIGGGALGLGKGLLLCTLALFVGADTGFEPVERLFRGATTVHWYRQHLGPALATIPEVRVARSVGNARRIAKVVRARPQRLERLVRHPELARLRSYAPLHAVADDPAFREAIADRRIDAILKNRAVVSVLKQRETARRIADVDFERILRDVEAEAPPTWLFPGATGGAESAEAEAEAEALGFPVGQVVSGVVRFVVADGLILDLGDDVSGLVRSSELSPSGWGDEVARLFARGDRIDAVVRAASEEDRRVTLSRRAAMADPWADGDDVIARYPMRHEVTARVIRMGPAAILVSLEEGVEAVVAHAAIAEGKRKELALGDEVQLRIIGVELSARRLAVRFRGGERGDK